MVLNSDNHLESSSSRDEVNITEAEGNVVPMEELNDDGTERHDAGQQPQQQQNQGVDAPSNTVELTEAVPTTNTNTIADSENQSSADDDYEDEPEESLGERLMALSDIFPEPFRDIASKASYVTKSSFHQVFKTTCRLTWVLVTSALVLLAPIAFENERSQLQELQKMHEKKMLFGPNPMVVAPRLGEKIVSH